MSRPEGRAEPPSAGAPAGSWPGRAVGIPQRSRSGPVEFRCVILVSPGLLVSRTPFTWSVCVCPRGNENAYVGHLGTRAQRSSPASASPASAPGLGVCVSEKAVRVAGREEAPERGACLQPPPGAAAQNLTGPRLFLRMCVGTTVGAFTNGLGPGPGAPHSWISVDER